MTMNDRINKAREYVAAAPAGCDVDERKNDAANIFADSYEQYNQIWDSLR